MGRLTRQELRVARMLAHRRTNYEIAQELGISVNTVKRHVSMVLLKLGVSSRLDIERATERFEQVTYRNDAPRADDP